MVLVRCDACGNEVSEQAPVCLPCATSCAETLRASASQPATAQRGKMHAVTWVVTAALIPLLCWDVWRSQQEAHMRRQVSTASAKMSCPVWALPRH
jgi:hypothetical protein